MTTGELGRATVLVNTVIDRVEPFSTTPAYWDQIWAEPARPDLVTRVSRRMTPPAGHHRQRGERRRARR
jgi:hypothetical protein